MDCSSDVAGKYLNNSLSSHVNNLCIQPLHCCLLVAAVSYSLLTLLKARECNPCCFEGVSVNYFSGQDERPGGFSDGLCVSIVDKPLAFDYKLRDEHVTQATTD